MMDYQLFMDHVSNKELCLKQLHEQYIWYLQQPQFASDEAYRYLQ